MITSTNTSIQYVTAKFQKIPVMILRNPFARMKLLKKSSRKNLVLTLSKKSYNETSVLSYKFRSSFGMNFIVINQKHQSNHS